eukprot:jgi/Hompol1/4688/HPOL_003811-RA
MGNLQHTRPRSPSNSIASGPVRTASIRNEQLDAVTRFQLFNSISPTCSLIQIVTLTLTHNLPCIHNRPVPQGVRKLCQIIRRKDGVSSANHTYELFIEEPGSLHITPILFARRLRSQTTSCYIITLFNARDRGMRDRAILKVKSNFLGTGFSIYEGSEADAAAGNNGALRNSAEKRDSAKRRREYGAVMYEQNFLGHKGPRKMTVILPPVRKDGIPVEIRSIEDRDSMMEKLRQGNDRDLLVMHNKTPQWNEETQSFVLNFNGRVTLSSVKNFQLVHDHDLEYIALQFGRISEDTFTLDVQYPFSLVQAFAITLTSFDAKLACE